MAGANNKPGHNLGVTSLVCGSREAMIGGILKSKQYKWYCHTPPPPPPPSLFPALLSKLPPKGLVELNRDAPPTSRGPPLPNLTPGTAPGAVPQQPRLVDPLINSFYR